eukprot:scaffold854_cov84-Amphora_coffeaeformis.AAC.1
MLVQYVDDCGISAPDQTVIDKFVEDLRKEGLSLTQEEQFSEFLGIDFEESEEGRFHMTQRGLIKKVLEAAGMTDCNSNSLPNEEGRREHPRPIFNYLAGNWQGPPPAETI